jgi:hypothetical protein
MSCQPVFECRKEELRRRVEALPLEVEQWKARTLAVVDHNAHHSQLQAIGILIDAFAQTQNHLLAQMDPCGSAVAFEDTAFELVKKIISSQRAWDFFRDKLDLRFSPDFAPVLYVADMVAWDCYRPVLEEAAGAGILDHHALREPPLTYLTAEFSPATWVRGNRPNDGRVYDLGESLLPIPVIQLPWDHVKNAWEFMSLHHEVGHDLEADLGLRKPLRTSLQQALSANNVPPSRILQWSEWLGEIFADLIGLQLGGPAFTEAMMHLLLLPEPLVTTLDPDDPHPTHYPRILMNAAYIPTLVAGYAPLATHAQEISQRWTDIYGPQPQFTEILDEFPLVVQAVMDTPLAELKGRTVRQLAPYTQADDLRIRRAVGYLQTGQNKPVSLRPRHCISAARLAVTEAALSGTLAPALLDQINQRAMDLVRENAPSGLLGGDSSAPHKQFIASFADKF